MTSLSSDINQAIHHADVTFTMETLDVSWPGYSESENCVRGTSPNIEKINHLKY